MRFFSDQVKEADVQGNIFDEIEYYLCRKKQNDENLPRQVLETRYKKNYTKMKNNIWSRFMKISARYCFGNFLFLKEDTEETQKFANNINRIVENAKKNGLFARVQECLFEQYDLQAALETIMPIKTESMEYYKEYWYSKCSPCNAPGYPYFNKLINMWYSEEKHMWMKKDNKSIEFIEMLPPPGY